jgi:hypothetical protein
MVRELKRIDIKKQQELTKKHAKTAAWPQAAARIVELYRKLV